MEPAPKMSNPNLPVLGSGNPACIAAATLLPKVGVLEKQQININTEKIYLQLNYIMFFFVHVRVCNRNSGSQACRPNGAQLAL